MNPLDLIHRLEANAAVIEVLVREVTYVHARWRPAEGKWSIVEVVNHLLDEEREDFRRRLDLTLHHPGQEWPPIDPERWVIERNYRDRDLQESLRDFLGEREASIAWLQDLVDPNWDQVHIHSALGSFTARSILASWIAHDFLHVRQLTRLHYQYLAHLVQPKTIEYAGEWRD